MTIVQDVEGWVVLFHVNGDGSQTVVAEGHLVWGPRQDSTVVQTMFDTWVAEHNEQTCAWQADLAGPHSWHDVNGNESPNYGEWTSLHVGDIVTTEYGGFITADYDYTACPTVLETTTSTTNPFTTTSATSLTSVTSVGVGISESSEISTTTVIQPPTCDELGLKNIPTGDINYYVELDADHDGFACDFGALPVTGMNYSVLLVIVALILLAVGLAASRIKFNR